MFFRRRIFTRFMSQNTNDASRKPSGSSSLSGTHSPLGSPGNVCRHLMLKFIRSRIIHHLWYLGPFPAESASSYDKQCIWSRRRYARGLDKCKPQLRVASRCTSPPPFPFTHQVQVWRGATPSPQRNVSASSAPATTDPLSTQGDVPFRSNITEGWRSNSGTWVDSDAGEFALVSPLKRRTEIACLVSTFESMLTSIRAAQDRSASRKVSPSPPVL